MSKDGLQMALTMVAASLPFIVALLVALRPNARPRNTPEDYFLFERKLSPGLFLKTSVGYSLQVASIVLFLLWTLSYGASSLFIPIAWGGGYLLVYAALRKGWLDTFLASTSDECQTIHGYVGSETKRGQLLVSFMAIATIVGLGGTLIAEIDYTTTFVLGAVQISADAHRYIDEAIHIAILLFTGCYVLWGGYRAVVLTDEAQVPMSYASFGVVLLAVCGLSTGEAGSFVAGVLALCAAGLFALFLFRRHRVVKCVTTQDVLLLGGLSVLGVVVGVAAIVEAPSRHFSVEIFPSNEFLWGFGLVGVVSLSIANAMWQFVDISSLQRLKSVSFAGDNRQITREHVGRGLRAAAVEAGGVWVLVILLALALKAQGVGKYEEIASFFWNQQGLAILLLPVLVFAYVVFMMSTIDGFISGMSFVAFYDIHARLQTSADDQGKTGLTSQLLAPRWTTIVTIFVIYGGYLLLKARTGGQLAQILYAIYALQSSIFPVVFARLIWPRKVSSVAGVLSIVAGFCCALYAAVWGERWEWIPLDSWYVIPPLATFLGAGITYIVAAGIAHRLDRGKQT